mmetsp:Transcript_19560/g.35849  ORF Transcript_19560/g.35849 Transcript_19560/m.35849 type:complete len:218 (-) Transcript_19560:12-665(-)
MQEDEFKEIQLKDLSERNDSPAEHPRVLNIPLPVYKIGHLGFAPQQSSSLASGGLLQPGPNGHASMVVSLNEREIRFGKVLKQAKVARWLSILDFFAIFLYLIALLFPLLVLIPAPALGYCAGRRLNRVLTLCYCLYLALTFLLRIVLCAVVPITAFKAVQGVLVVLNALEICFFVRFFRTLGSLSPSEREELLVQQNGVRRGMMFNPQPLHTMQSN